MRFFAALASTNAGRKTAKRKKRRGEGGDKLRENLIKNK